ncbi:hypothetical protein U1769_11325 [Sphingomonas sp. ZT3P38]
MIDQIDLHQNEIDPVVTVVVKCANDKTITYSSWARFKALRVGNHDVTSEITLKFEFVILLPNTQSPQRCIVNINLDSSLPVIIDHRKDTSEAESFGLFFVMKREWRTVKVNIDFVDFLIAKSFTGLAEEWFNSLNRTPEKKFNAFLLRNMSTIRFILGQAGRLGMASFLASYTLFSDEYSFTLPNIVMAVSLGLVIWSLLVIVESSLSSRVMKRVAVNIIPTVILLTDTDIKSYGEIKNGLNSPFFTIASGAVSIAAGILLNVIASYIFAYLHP